MKISIQKTINGFHVTVEEASELKEYVWREADYSEMLEKLAYMLAGEKVRITHR